MNRLSPFASAAKAALAAAVSLAPSAPACAAENAAAQAQLVRQRVFESAFFAPSAPRYGEAAAVAQAIGEAGFTDRAREIVAAHPGAMAKVEAFARGLSPEEISYLNALPSAVSERAGKHVTAPFSELTAAYPVSNDPSFVVARSAAMAGEVLNGEDVAALAALARREPRHPALEKAVAFSRDFSSDPDCLALASDLAALLRARGDSWEGRADLLAMAAAGGTLASVIALAGFLVFLATRGERRRAARPAFAR